MVLSSAIKKDKPPRQHEKRSFFLLKPSRVVWFQWSESLGHATDCAGRSCSRRPFEKGSHRIQRDPQNSCVFWAVFFYRGDATHKKMPKSINGKKINIWKKSFELFELFEFPSISFGRLHCPKKVCKSRVKARGQPGKSFGSITSLYLHFILSVAELYWRVIV